MKHKVLVIMLGCCAARWYNYFPIVVLTDDRSLDVNSWMPGGTGVVVSPPGDMLTPNSVPLNHFAPAGHQLQTFNESSVSIM